MMASFNVSILFKTPPERVHSALDYVSPFDFEAMYYDKINPLGQVA